MSKAILVIDTPDGCLVCPLLYACEATKKARPNSLRKTMIEADCPLKDLPEKKLPRSIPNDCDIEEKIQIINEIYNVCFDEILGEENE